MSRSSDHVRELERWKDKYFDLNESIEEERKLGEEYTALLQRFLSRISLAAEHVDDELDRELGSLRIAMREATPKNNDLDKRLKRIDAILLSTDEQKNQNAERAMAAFNDIIGQLLSLNLSGKDKRGLKRLARSLKKRGDQFKDYPNLLSDYGALQADVLKGLVQDGPQGGNFLSRFFGNKSSASPIPDKPVVEGATLSSDQEIEDDHPEMDLDDAHANVDDFRSVPGYSAVAKHIQGTLERLLEQLIFPVSVQSEVDELKERIANDLNWYELGPTLSDLANLVIAALGKGQRDFERFLLVLNERLSRVQSSILETESFDERWRQQSHELDRIMREHVTEMSREVDDAGDIEGLKSSITEHLDTISAAMNRFSNEGQQRDSEKDEQLKRMKERLQNMEQEAAVIRKKLREEREHALTDILTALPNREAFDERFELEFERWKRYKKPVVMVVADVDLFKTINDTYGHLAGDKVLQILAKEMRHRLRKTDFLARYGGEEFVMLLPETELEVAKEVIDKARDMVSRLPFHFREQRINVTLSFGLVPFSEGMEREALFELADKAMYQAKQNGRNRVEVAVPDLSAETRSMDGSEVGE